MRQIQRARTDRRGIVLLALIVFVTIPLSAKISPALHFEENRGQWPAEVHYAAQTRLGPVGIMSDGAWIMRGRQLPPLRLRLVESNPAPIVAGEERLPFRTHRFIGADRDRWTTGIPTFRKVVNHSVYPGVDLLFHGETAVEYDFVVAPGADPSAIRLRFEGASSVRLTDQGDLLLGDGAADVRIEHPVAYQLDEGVQEPVDVRFMLSDETVSFAVGDYDRNRTLVIDPVVVGYSTFLGGSSSEVASAVTVDTDRNIYLTGFTSSADFPVTQGSERPPVSGPNDTFVAKIGPRGDLVFVTFLGGSDDDGSLFRGIAVDSSGAVYVASATRSRDFPTTEGALQRDYAGGARDGFITKLSDDGSQILASTYLGGAGLDRLEHLALDAFRDVYVAGFTESSDFPTTELAYQRDRRGQSDAFVTKLRMQPLEIVYSTLVGGSGEDHGRKVAVDLSGAAFVAGNTRSADYPVSDEALQREFGGMGTVSTVRGDVFLTKLDPSGSELEWSTFLGGGQGENADSLAIDRKGASFLSGLTCSSDFPVSEGAVQSDLRGQCDGFVAGISPDGGSLSFGTYIGGGATDEAWGVSVDFRGNIHVGGSTSSSDFPVTDDALQPQMGGGGHDGMLAILSSDGSELLQSSFLGGTAPPENVFAIATDRAGSLYLTGSTQSADFVITDGVLQETIAGQEDVFVTRVALDAPRIEGERSILPVVGSTQGGFGSLFKTSVQLHNPTEAQFRGRFVFHPEGASAAADDPSLEYFLDPHETIAFSDLLPSIGTSGIGSMDLITPDGESPVSLVRVYNDAGEEGTTGLSAERIEPFEAPGEGDTAVLIAPISFERSRFNIGIRTLDEGVTVTATVRRSDGSKAGARTLSWPAEFFLQRSAADLLGMEIMTNDSIAFHVDDGSAVIYGATTDNVTQDPSIQLAKTVDSVEGERRILPVVGSTPGQFGSFFKTSLQLHNAASETISGQIVHHAPRPAAKGLAPAQSVLEYDLDPGETVAFEDLLPALGRSGIGSLDLMSISGPLPLTVARVYNDAGEAGTTGITEEQVALDQVLQAGDRGVVIGPADPARARLNIGIRTLEEGATISATVRNGAGVVIREVTLSYPGTQFIQLPATNLLGVAFVGNDVVELRIESGSAIVYAAITDNMTQDPTMILARRRN